MKKIKSHITALMLLNVVFSQTSIITISGTGTSATSAHITIGTDCYKCPDGLIVEDGASLTKWDPSATCSGSIAAITISGVVEDKNNVGVKNVSIVFSNGGATVITNATGHYSTSVAYGWNGTSTPAMDGWEFDPVSQVYPDHLTSDQTDQDFAASAATPNSLNISGYVKDGVNLGVEGVNITFSNGGATVTTNATGHYSTSVAYGWNGTSTPSMDGWEFDPVSHVYPDHLATDLTDQDFVGADMTLAVEDVTALPTEFTILPAYPNPFNPTTTIRYGLPDNVETLHATSLLIQIYDITGKLITTLVNGEQSPGWHSVVWNGTNQYGELAPAGLYFSKITSGNEMKTTRLMLLK